MVLTRDDSAQQRRIEQLTTLVTQKIQFGEQVVRLRRDAGAQAASELGHEIRTPMNGVIGMTDLVMDTDLSSEQREYLQIVKSSADALLIVINDILDFARMEAGKFELDPIDFKPRDAIGDTANTLALRAHQKGLELIVDVGADVPRTLKGDLRRLRQILVNLLGNAIKFTHQGQVVLRVTSEAALPGDIVDVVLHFAVKDTGVGIPVDRQKTIFEAFTQADGSPTRAYGGTGLGLTISSQLAQLMGGRLWLESEAGIGSTFHFTARFAVVNAPAGVAAVADAADLRQAAGHESPALVTRHSLREGQTGLVLLVEDNGVNQLVARRLLEKRGHKVVVANDGREALAILDDAAFQGFGCVLMDVQMPVMGGFEATAAIRARERERGGHLPIIAMTAHAMEADEARCLTAGMDAYLSKPIQANKLFAVVERYFGVSSVAVSRPVASSLRFLDAKSELAVAPPAQHARLGQPFKDA